MITTVLPKPKVLRQNTVKKVEIRILAGTSLPSSGRSAHLLPWRAPHSESQSRKPCFLTEILSPTQMNKIKLLEFLMRFIAQGLNLIHTLSFSL